MNNTWIWNIDINDKDDLSRIKSSKEIAPMEIEKDETIKAVFHGSSGDYNTTLTNCECSDFLKKRAKQGKPCKHIIALGATLGLHNLYSEIETKEIQDQLALAYGYFYLFNNPIITDTQYNKLKNKLESLKNGFCN